MTHTLHRIKSSDGYFDDYVVLIMPARGINNENSADVLRKYCDLLYGFSPINMGGIGSGTLALNSFDEMKARITNDTPMIHAVYRDRATLQKVLKSLKEADYGYSVVVSGLLDDVNECANAVGIKRHSVDISLGIWGKTDRLPRREVLEISTMCGHAMVSPVLILKMARDVHDGKITAAKAAAKLARPCACGIFNTEKTERLLKTLATSL